MSVVPAMLAERLGVPQLTFAKKVDGRRHDTITIQRLTDDGYQVVEASTAGGRVSVVEKINEPRYPSFKGIMAAKKKPVETLGARRPRRRRRRGRPGRRVDARSSRFDGRAAAAGRARSSRTRATAADKLAEFLASQEVHLRRDWTAAMAEVLVLVEHVDGEVKKVTARAADARPPARRAGRGVRRQRLRRREGQAGRVRRGQGLRRRRRRRSSTTSSRPTAEVLAQLVAEKSPGRRAARRPTAEGKEIAGRLAVKTGSGVLTDATDVTADGGPRRRAVGVRRLDRRAARR